MKLRINLINQMDTYFVIKKSNFLCSKHHKKLYIQKNMHLIYKQDYYEDKLKDKYDLFIDDLVPIMENIDNHTLIEEWKQKY